MKVKELMVTDVHVVREDALLKDVAALLVEKDVSGVPVCDPEGRLLGIVSEADILYKEQARRSGRGGPLGWLVDGKQAGEILKGAARTAGQAMTSPPVTIGPERSVAEAARLMIERKVNRLPVVRGDELVGIVTRSDLVRAFTRTDAEILEEIQEHVLKRALWIEPKQIEIEVDRGEVTLTGELEGRSDAQLLVTLVKRVPGVVDVRSNVRWRVDDTKRALSPT
jgi:CBS domain-containing protein